jgi:hypothetical protein
MQDLILFIVLIYFSFKSFMKENEEQHMQMKLIIKEAEK